MYRVSPLTYLVGGMLSTGVAQIAVSCSDLEVLHFLPPQSANLTCGEYMAPYQQLAGGTVLNPNSTQACEFCPLAQTDAFLASVDIFYSDRWRNYGLMWAYIVFNVFAALALYWLARVPKRKVKATWVRVFGQLKAWERVRGQLNAWRK
jgi:ABC-type multidrug transport system permease subunit